jgi:hypothetical protein
LGQLILASGGNLLIPLVLRPTEGHRGNVTREIDAESKITDRTYDDNNWVLSETVISEQSAFPMFDRYWFSA